MNYYNEFDPQWAHWLKNLIAAGLIPKGDVDDRSIVDVRATDLTGYAQCHFFAGIGGWAEAIRLAGLQSDLPLWSGSPPCQSFSAAGKGKGFDDPRHLWPVFFRLIQECRPAIVVGEQVEAAVRHGWLDLVQADLEGAGYATGAVVLGAHSVGAPHQRQRLYWGGVLVYANRNGCQSRCATAKGDGHRDTPDATGGFECLADATSLRCVERGQTPEAALQRADAERAGQPALGGHTGQLPGRVEGLGGDSGSCADHSGWGRVDWLGCQDGRFQPVEPGLAVLADGVSPFLAGRSATAKTHSRTTALKGFGNAIVPQAAAAFLRDFLDSVEEAQ